MPTTTPSPLDVGMPRIEAPMRRQFQQRIRQAVPAPLKRVAKRWLAGPRKWIGRSRLPFGVQPISQTWGERGPTLHRYYLETFLEGHAEAIRGRCLEFQSDTYSTRFGRKGVGSIDVLHRDPGRAGVTIVADLTGPNDIPDNAFDCIVCTYVLHVVRDADKVTSELHRILKPGGTLLACVPDITIQYPQHQEFWRFTADGLRLLLERHFADDDVLVTGYGNSLTAAGELRGLVLSDFSRSEYECHDPRYSVIICARATKR